MAKGYFRGVSWSKSNKKWHVQISHKNKKIHGGLFTNLAEAEQKAIELRQQYFTHNEMDKVTV